MASNFKDFINLDMCKMLAEKGNTLAIVFIAIEQSRINESVLYLICKIQYARILMCEIDPF